MQARPRTVALVLVLAGLAMAVLVAGGAAWVWWRSPKDDQERYQGVAVDLAELAQSVDEPLTGLHLAWLPASALQSLGPIDATAKPGSVSLSSGRDGPRYTLSRRDGQSSTGTVWMLDRTSRDDEGPTLLATVDVPRDRKLTRAQLIERIYAKLDADLVAAPHEIGTHMTRVECAFRFEPSPRVRARSLLVDSIRRSPEMGEVRMALALVDAADQRETGMEELHRWAHEKPTFVKLSDLALAHWMRNAPDPAIAAARESLGQPVTERDQQHFNATARIVPIAELAYRHGRNADVIALVDRIAAMEPSASTKQHFALDLRALKAAAVFMNGDRRAANALVEDGLEEKDAFYRPLNDRRLALVKTIRTGDEAGVRAFVPNPGTDMVRGMFANYDLLKVLGLPSPQPALL